MHFQNYPTVPSVSSLAQMPREALAPATVTPPPDADAAMAALLARFSAADFDPDNVVFPDETSGVYTDVTITEYRLRVYAVMHLGESTSSLFLILGSLKGSYLPVGSRVSVKEQHLLLSDPGLHWTEHSTYVYTQVFGDWKEQFTIEIVLPNARPKVLAPLAFKADKAERSHTSVIDQMAA
ncbi:MAG: hypothetical protein AB8B99_25330 [Phormidesmis sp.]